MKSKEDMAVKGALAGGVAGVLLGILSALISFHQSSGGAVELLNGGLTVVLWGFILAMVGAAIAYGGMFVAERKLGLASEESGPDQIILKTSYLRGLQTETQKCYLSIGTRVTAANQHLVEAEKEFNEGAFAPFWDAIERAANELAAYKNEVEHLQRNVAVYNNESGELKRLGGESVAPLALPPYQLPDARPAADRFMGIVRKAQTNFQFAMIFEQRKTNQLLHTGFGNLGTAIYTLGESINASLDKLTKSIETNTERMLSYQDPLRHGLSKIKGSPKKPEAAPPPRLPRFDSSEG